MNRKTLFITLLAVITLPGIGRCETPGKPVSRLFPGMAWKVEVLSEKERTLFGGKSGKKLSSSAVEAQGTAALLEENVMGVNFRQQTSFIHGTRRTCFIQEDQFFVLGADGGYTMDSAREGISVASPKRLDEFEWVKAKWLVGVMMVDGVECDIYRRPAGARDNEAQRALGEKEAAELAAIGKQDRFPRRLETLFQVKRYTPLPTVSPPPHLPPEVVMLVKETQERLDRQDNRYRIAQ